MPKPTLNLQLTHFFEQLFRLPTLWQLTQLNIKEIPLALIEQNQVNKDKFDINVYKYRAKGLALEEDLSHFEKSVFKELPIFCNFSSTKSACKYILEYEQTSYYVRPLSLWLSPVAFLLLPLEHQSQWETLCQKSDFIQDNLSFFLYQRIKYAFDLEHLSNIPSKAQLQQELIKAIATIIMPHSWQINNTLAEYANYLFTSSSKDEILTLTFPDGQSISFHMPPIRSSINTELPFSWAYEDKFLQEKKEVLSYRLNALISHIFKQYNNLHGLINDRNTLPAVAKKLTELEVSIEQITGQIGDLNRIMKRIQIGKNTKLNKAYLFYMTPDQKKFIIKFDNVLISCLGLKASSILYVLLSNPHTNYDTDDLHSLAKDLKKTSKKHEIYKHLEKWDKEKGTALKEYLSKDLITEIELNKAIAEGRKHEYRERLEKAIHIFKYIKSNVPDTNIDFYLNNYISIYNEHYKITEEDLYNNIPRSSTSYKNTQRLRREDRKRSIASIEKQLREAKKTLKANQHVDFANYIDRVIYDTRTNNKKYYAFDPQRAASEEFQNINWILENKQI